jgi:hypothetical protein
MNMDRPPVPFSHCLVHYEPPRRSQSLCLEYQRVKNLGRNCGCEEMAVPFRLIAAYSQIPALCKDDAACHPGVLDGCVTSIKARGMRKDFLTAMHKHR